VALVLGLLAAYLAISYFQPLKGAEGEGDVRVAIPTGATVEQIGEILEERGVVSSSFWFKARATLGQRRGDLRPGSYTLGRGMSYGGALDALAAGPPPPKVVNLVLPEGRSRREVSPTVRNAGIEGAYLSASKSSRALNPTRYGAPAGASLEGFLFPATYELKPGASARALVTKQLEAFKREFRKVDLRAARRSNLSPYEVLTIASMVERETALPRERALISGVIYNRLRQGEPLGIDATIRFATGNWEKPLKESELAIDSPYNTRKNAGLPPGPIGSPGLASIKAAARPRKSSFLFYVVKPCGEGEHAFSRTLDEFNRDVKKYNAERQRQGGNSPTKC